MDSEAARRPAPGRFEVEAPLDPGSDGAGGRGTIGVVAALGGELAPLAELWRARERLHGLEVCVGDLAGRRLLGVVAGVGKVRAAAAARALVERGARGGLLSVGVCGGLRSGQRVGDLVHCVKAVQADFAVREDRACDPDPELAAAWREVAPGRAGWFLTADRPALSPWRRLRLARAWGGDCVADMETAAVAAVAQAAGVPWAALRAVSDALDLATFGLGRRARFTANYPHQAGRAAATIPALLERL